jgi:protein-S-isoprenylcysteine O-methyltransferase Ste14
MTINQHSGGARPEQIFTLALFHLSLWSAVAVIAFRLGHGEIGVALTGPLTASLAWAVLAAAELVAQPVAPATVEAEDSPWRVWASRLLFTLVPVAAWDAAFSPIHLVSGALMLLGGGALRWWSLKTLGPQFTWTTGVVAGHKLLRTGPYRFMKHPNYFGSVVFAAGIVVVSGSRWGWLPVVLIALAVIQAARHESAFLRSRLPGYR